tara:strand:+ start:1303 stop:1635 length:333 start_codon:yes stop_codon:yes gene_type:complete
LAVNYTQEQVDYMKTLYDQEPTRDTVQKLANELNKSVKSIIGKLSREGVYQKTEYLSKTGERPITKKQMVEIIAKELVGESSKLAGLEKAPKADLKYLLDLVSEESPNGE